MPSRQHREKKPKSDGSDVPDVVNHITNGDRHCGLSLRLAFFVFMAYSFSALEAENAANRLGYQACFDRANNADRNPAGSLGNHALIRISLFF
jgi:hypothetical protein